MKISLVVGEDLIQSKLNRSATLIRKSHSSDQLLSIKDCSSEYFDSPSPTSVLLAGPHLQTILSGKQVDSFQDLTDTDSSCISLSHTVEGAFDTETSTRNRQLNKRRRSKRRSGAVKSLSELEFEELKGFMDLGFVFTAGDDQKLDSKLVSIIPGLQRLGKNVDESASESESESVSRPYLSEAWNYSSNNPAMKDWRIPAFGNEMELKHHLRFWAHSVASYSSVRS
ncbi:hypothetical protein MIMGU_mgv11b016324mg [Erythranthe guttata]|uniref:DUF1685 domain-containing protein n=2 Tax=Erythranthe guttata TaxID=4155 RepID=A0A022RAG5_ERYGU|nr:hypothetical protein MIMGU_mgv11b016324mg [Erythranthe guttata]